MCQGGGGWGRGGASLRGTCAALQRQSKWDIYLSKTCEEPQTISEFEDSKLLQKCLVWHSAAEAVHVLAARLHT